MPVFSGLMRSDGYGPARSRTVKTERLEDILLEQGWSAVDFLKVDTEGFDFKVIRGAGKYVDHALIKVIQFEYGGNWQMAGDTLLAAVEFLAKRGYTTFVLKADGLHPFDVHFVGDYFVFSNFVAIRENVVSNFRSLIRARIGGRRETSVAGLTR